MYKQKMLASLVVCVALLVMGVLLSPAAPLVPQDQELADPVRSLAGLKQLRVQIRVSSDAAGAELDVPALGNEWRQKLRDAGFELLEAGDDIPLLELTLTTVSDPKLPGGLGVGTTLMLYQRVHVPRLQTDLTVPTYVHNPVGAVPLSQLDEQVRAAADFVINVFIQNCRRADESRR